jgi:hypothetical protein
LLVLCAVGLYHGALGLWRPTEFTYDDVPIVAQNLRLDVGSWEDAKQLVVSKYWGDSYAAERLWRPVPLATLAVDRSLHGDDPDGYRWTNVALHALIACLVWALLRKLLRARLPALAGALLFAAHPIHAESVAGVVGRSELLALAFSLGGILLHLRGRAGRPGSYPAASLCFLLGFLCKEIALTGPFLLIVVEVAARGPLRRSSGMRRLARAVCSTWSRSSATSRCAAPSWARSFPRRARARWAPWVSGSARPRRPWSAGTLGGRCSCRR